MSRLAVLLLLGLVLVSGCAKGSGDAPHPTGPTAVGAAESGKRVSANLQDSFLFDHNASFNDGRTFRWVTPIPIFVGTPEPAVTRVVLDQFLAWESALGGAGGTPFYAPQPVPQVIPRRGIFFTEADLPGNVVGFGDPFVVLPESRRSVAAAQLRKLVIPATPRRVEVPEILGTGEIQRCLIVLDPALENASDLTIMAVIRHEIGHCLGFIGHVATGLMKPTCCALNFTPDVVGMMKRLYNLPPGTPVSR
jgi:hypothetical protein